ncbi:hypothetical protein [Absicoccus intestinalis]|uniref:Uncharacterized protein n=1 Tax=Absicoccus intestinalis TaxID=2926319 RepID=A0ABU4WM63_9FIRM|nr:hypothetical protein [Absicoccus sp. CLA-KB-P134]MDX8416562.1 hypothetical protein [Absicoccus sp. CLA-KB-P134]
MDDAIMTVRGYCHGRIPDDLSEMETQEPTAYRALEKCVYRVADRLKDFDKAFNQMDGIASETTDGHSVTFEKRDHASQEADLYRLVRKHLMPTGLLYSGYDPYWDDRKW